MIAKLTSLPRLSEGGRVGNSGGWEDRIKMKPFILNDPDILALKEQAPI